MGLRACQLIRKTNDVQIREEQAPMRFSAHTYAEIKHSCGFSHTVTVALN